MSFTVNLYYKGKNGAASRFAEEMESSGVADGIRAEEGNERYEYYVSLRDPETVLLTDRWSDQAALDNHHASPYMKEVMRLREKYSLTVSAERFADESEIPRKDKDFLGKR